MPATVADAAEVLRSSLRHPLARTAAYLEASRRSGKTAAGRNSRHVRAYLFVRLYGGSKAKARAAVVESFQPFAKTKRRQIGRAIRTGERIFNRLRSVGPGYRSYDEQRRLYERWKAGGRGAVAVPTTDPQMGSHHSRGVAIDLSPFSPVGEAVRKPWHFTYPDELAAYDCSSAVRLGSGA